MYKLIIADDEEIVRNGMKNTIDWASIGFEIAGLAENGYDVLRLVEKNKPHAILTDIRMPVMDGLELARKVYDLYPDIKVILISAYNDFKYAQEAIQYKVKGYLLKPFTKDAFNEVLRSVIKEIEDEENEEEMRRFNKNVLFSMQRDNCLKALLKGTGGERQDIGAKLEEYHLLQPEGFTRVAVCNFERLSKTDGASAAVDQILSGAQGFWEKQHIPSLFYKDYLVVFFNSAKAISKSEADFFLQQFRQYISDTLDCTGDTEKMTAGVGNVYRGVEMIGQSYAEAIYAYSVKYFRGSGSAIFYQDLCNKTYSLLKDTDINPIVDKVVGDIFASDHYSLVMDINALFEYIEQKGCFAANDIQIKFMEIIMTIIIRAKNDSIEVISIQKEDALKNIQTLLDFQDLKQWFKQTVYLLLKEIEDSRNKTMNGSGWLVNKAKAFVHQNYARKISLEDISMHLHMNASYFSSAFKKAAGQSFIDYVNEVKMNKARELLKEPEYRIKEIAQRLGYDDFAYFCKVFKKMFGVPPLQFRSGLVLNKGEREP